MNPFEKVDSKKLKNSFMLFLNMNNFLFHSFIFCINHLFDYFYSICFIHFPRFGALKESLESLLSILKTKSLNCSLIMP